MRQVTIAPTFSSWQKTARELLRDGVRPEEAAWEELLGEQPALGLFEEAELSVRARRAEPATKDERAGFRVPKAFVTMASRVACHRDPRRWAMLYRVLWRLTHGEPRLLEISVDPDVDELMRMDSAVRRDVHKMRAFVRFRQVAIEQADNDALPVMDDHRGASSTAAGSAPPASWYVAWFEPEHHIVELNAPFFVDRFAGMHWSILTPERCAHWDGGRLSFTAGVPKAEAPDADAMEELWRTYYGHIFNPARVKTRAMQKEMPKRYWKNLPEAAIIPVLIGQAPGRTAKMIAASTAAHSAREAREKEYGIAQPPATDDWSALRKAACACRACPLWRDATQTVFGEGPRPAEVMLLGEQPGDAEDLAGQPFVGPAGKLLDRALAEAGIDRGRVYVTNTVKHFKWEPRGKRRLHQTPDSRDIAACRPWLEAEMRLVQPRILVCLGATAATAVFGPGVRVQRDRGEWRASAFAPETLITFHPSALLRAPDEAARKAQFAQFLNDLALVAARLSRSE